MAMILAGSATGLATGGTADTLLIGLPGELRQMLGDGVVEPLDEARPISDPLRITHWEPGEWTYRFTSGDRRGHIERETLVPIELTLRGETWSRIIGTQYTLYVRRTMDGGLVLPSEVAHAHQALVLFDPPLTYLLPTLRAGEAREFDGRMAVYRASDPATRWYSGRIRATTVHAGLHRVKTPAGTFSATLIRTNYQIDILAVVSVTDTLYTFYAEGIGKVAEAEHQRISAIALFNSETHIGKVLIAFNPTTQPSPVQAP